MKNFMVLVFLLNCTHSFLVGAEMMETEQTDSSKVWWIGNDKEHTFPTFALAFKNIMMRKCSDPNFSIFQDIQSSDDRLVVPQGDIEPLKMNNEQIECELVLPATTVANPTEPPIGPAKFVYWAEEASQDVMNTDAAHRPRNDVNTDVDELIARDLYGVYLYNQTTDESWPCFTNIRNDKIADRIIGPNASFFTESSKTFLFVGILYGAGIIDDERPLSLDID